MIGANALAPHKLGRLAAGAPRVRWSRPDRGALAPDLAPGEVRLYWQRMPGAGSGTLAAAPVLARHLGCGAHELEFERERGGRPRLRAPRTDLRFNLAHSGARLVLAVGHARRFGIDVERIRPGRDYLALARHQFQGEELELVARQPAARRAVAFLRLWTAKEALAKALGRGLDAMPRIELRRGPGGTLRPHALPRAAGDPASWRVLAFTPEPGYLATLAIQG